MTPAVRVLRKAKVSYRILEYEHDPGARGYGDEAASALGLDRQLVFKTLVVDTGSGFVIAVVPVQKQLDLKALAHLLRTKRVKLADTLEAERLTGYVVGGISPLGQKKRVPTWIDQSALDFDRVYVSGGRRGLELEITPSDLVGLTGARCAPIAR